MKCTIEIFLFSFYNYIRQGVMYFFKMHKRNEVMFVDINVLHAVLIAMIPVIIAIVLAWAYNVIHGAISYLVMTYLLVFSLEAFATTLPEGLSIALGDVMVMHEFMFEYMISWIHPMEYSTAKYVMLGILIASFIVSQVLSSLIRKAKVNKIRSLKQKVKRY